jgi:hypothetical protein
VRVEAVQQPGEQHAQVLATRTEPAQPPPHRRCRKSQRGRDRPMSRAGGLGQQCRTDHRHPVSTAREPCRAQQHMASSRNPCNTPGEADAAQCLPPGGKSANAHGPTASAHHTPRTGQPASKQQTFDHDRIGIYHQHWVHSKHQVTALLLAKAWEGRRAFPGHGHALDANPRGNPKSHIVVLSDADLPTGGQPRCRSTGSALVVVSMLTTHLPSTGDPAVLDTLRLPSDQNSSTACARRSPGGWAIA